MPRPSHLSSDNILRFLQVRRDAASVDDIAAGLHMRRADRNALHKMLNTLKKRRAVEELPGGRYRLAGRKDGRDGDGPGAWREAATGTAAGGCAGSRQLQSQRDQRATGFASRWIRICGAGSTGGVARPRRVHSARCDRRRDAWRYGVGEDAAGGRRRRIAAYGRTDRARAGAGTSERRGIISLWHAWEYGAAL